MPLPFTTRDGIYKLLPQRSIDPRTGSIRTVRFTPPDRSGAAHDLVSALTTILSNWAQCGFSKRLVGLTAGGDSRTVLAAACAARIDFEAFTTNIRDMDKRDRILPPQVAARAGIVHRFRHLPPVEPSIVEARTKTISQHVDGIASHPVFARFAQFDHSADDDPQRTSASGSCFEIGRCYYSHKLSRVQPAGAQSTADQILEAFSLRSDWRPEPLEAWRSALRLWVESLSDDAPLPMDWRDRFYLEQCLASWNSNVQRANDFVESTGFSPANCLWIFHLLLRPDPEERRQRKLQREAISLMAPRLLELPINPESLWQRLSRAARALGRDRARRRRRVLSEKETF
ncbi:hypothetical protein [Dongia deserti]|uniref:hypothetical protein n=1 Tax=Dongia deserti TaxID=2268030 RepID=UPI0013C4E0AE|nr:hypothetical protein [Dongia deserti]